MKILKIISLLFLICSLSLAQPKSNLTIIYDLIDDNVNQLIEKLPQQTNKIIFEYSTLPEYESLESRFIYNLDNENYLVESEEDFPTLKYSLDQIGILYSEPFRGGLLSDYKIERRIFLNGTMALGKGIKVIKTDFIESTYRDTLFYSEIENVESPSLQITQGTKPSEPLFESLLEPVIAVGAVIVTIILLFTVRSK
mgnify:CR=1 FL=1